MNLNSETLNLDQPRTSPTVNAGAASPSAATAIDVFLSAEKNNVSMVVGEDDVIEGNLIVGNGKTIIVRGTVKGEIRSEGTVLICSGARVIGKILAASLMTEGTIGEPKQEATLDVGALHIGRGSRTFADCTYDTLCVDGPNGGVTGRMAPRAMDEAAHA